MTTKYGVIYGESRRNKTGIRQGNEVQQDEIKWKTNKLYTKVGIVLLNEQLFFKNKNTHAEKYGYRRIFPWENPDDIKKTWEEDERTKLPKFTLEMKDDLIESITRYIMSKNVFEEAKLERINFSEQATEDRAEKHEAVLTMLAEYFKETLDEMEIQFRDIAERNNLDHSLLEEISKKQDHGNNSQAEIITKLGEIHIDVTETKHAQIAISQTTEVIKSEVVIIKSTQEEMVGTMVTADQVQELVKTQTKDDLKSDVKDVINDALRENDPGPKIQAEIDRAAKRLKKNVEKAFRKLF